MFVRLGSKGMKNKFWVGLTNPDPHRSDGSDEIPEIKYIKVSCPMNAFEVLLVC